MSYTTTVKNNIINSGKTRKKCCKRAELYGCFFSSDHFSPDEMIIHQTNADVVSYFKETLNEITGNDFTEIRNGRTASVVISQKDARKVQAKLKIQHCDNVLDTDALSSDCCRHAFIRGVFLSCGRVSDPQTGYSLEFVFGDNTAAENFKRMLDSEKLDFKTYLRNKKTVIYTKKASDVRNFLSYLGSFESVFEYANAEMLKDMQNRVNRAMNCDSANMDKSIDVMMRQRAAIIKLKNDGYKGLSEDLIEIAEARLTNESSSLEALGKSFDPPIPKATIYRKLKKIAEIAESNYLKDKDK